MSIVDRPRAVPLSPSAPPAVAVPRQSPITLAMYDRMIAAGIADYWVVDLVSRAVIVFREARAGVYESRSTHRGDQLVRAEAPLSPAELFLPG